jgi:hypothetical protein
VPFFLPDGRRPSRCAPQRAAAPIIRYGTRRWRVAGGSRLGYTLKVWRLVIAFLTAVPIVACSTSCDPESAQKTASTRVATESEAESSALTSPPYSSDGLAPRIVEGDPRWLTGPKEPTTKRLNGDCSSLAAHGWEAECERVTTELGDAVWIREQQGQQESVSLYVHRGGDAWGLAWRATDESGREFDSKVERLTWRGMGTPRSWSH